jgi:hypothetical protein
MLQANIPVIQTSNSKAQGAIANHCALATSDHYPRRDRAKLDELARRYAESRVPEIIKDLYRLGLELEKMEKLEKP